MKKSIAILAVLAFVAVAASAQITIGGWGRALFVPIANVDSGDSVSSTVSSWAPATFPGDWDGKGRIGITIAGNSDNVGFQIDMNADGGALGMGDQQKIWVKPVDGLTLQIGKVYEETLRGNAAFGSFNWYRAFGSGTGEDVTFTRLGQNRGDSSFVATYAKDALFVGLDLLSVGSGSEKPVLTETLSKNMQVAAGYTIEGTGQIRGQVIRTYDAGADDVQSRVEVAFKYTGMENLYADVGFMMNTNTDLDVNETKAISAYAKYSMDKITLHGLAIYSMLADDDKMEFGAGVDYALEGGVGLSADVRYWNDIAAGGTDAKTTFFAGATKGFSNGLIGAGFEYVTQDVSGYAIPVRFEYWF